MDRCSRAMEVDRRGASGDRERVPSDSGGGREHAPSDGGVLMRPQRRQGLRARTRVAGRGSGKRWGRPDAASTAAGSTPERGYGNVMVEEGMKRLVEAPTRPNRRDKEEERWRQERRPHAHLPMSSSFWLIRRTGGGTGGGSIGLEISGSPDEKRG